MTEQTWEEFMQDVEKLENSPFMKLIKIGFSFLYISMFGAWFLWILTAFV